MRYEPDDPEERKEWRKEMAWRSACASIVHGNINHLHGKDDDDVACASANAAMVHGNVNH